MEFLIGIAVIFILLLCMGVSIEVIIQLAIGIICLFIAFMAAVFIYATVVLVTGKKVIGVFSEVDKGEKGKLPYARYMIEGTEYKNLFPLEVIFQDKIYVPDKEVKLVLNKKIKRCMDGNAVICCILGLLVSIFLMIWVYFTLSGII